MRETNTGNRGWSRRRAAVLAAIGVVVAGCDWAPLTRSGEEVLVARPEQVQPCRRIGETSAKTKYMVAGVNRDPVTVSQELQNLARNAAAEMKGDTIVPIGEPWWGEQRFTVYRCQP
ncbi:MAG: DUF4156 domain-containing protein [Gammaproteobacteria bacterium]|nr:DUF4156 domain-containing protein [Gammaproteobacteria bacterium]